MDIRRSALAAAERAVVSERGRKEQAQSPERAPAEEQFFPAEPIGAASRAQLGVSFIDIHETMSDRWVEAADSRHERNLRRKQVLPGCRNAGSTIGSLARVPSGVGLDRRCTVER